MLLLVVAERAGRREALGLGKYVAFLEANGRTFVELVGILAGCGLLIGAFSLTGVIASLANDLLTIAGGNALLLLVMCAITSLVLGPRPHHDRLLHLPRDLVGPALEKLGLNKMAVHMFIFYWGMLSSITPPVAIAWFAAAGIAGAPAMKTAGNRCRWEASSTFMPFFFVVNPALVLQAATPGGAVPYVEALYLMASAIVGIGLHLRRNPGLPGRRSSDLRQRRRARMASQGAADGRRTGAGRAGRRNNAAQRCGNGAAGGIVLARSHDAGRSANGPTRARRLTQRSFGGKASCPSSWWSSPASAQPGRA